MSVGGAAWLQRLRERAQQPPSEFRAPLSLRSGPLIGSIHPLLARKLMHAGAPLGRDGDGYVIEGDVDASLAAIAHRLRELGLLSGWRDELLAVRDDRQRVVGRIERAAVRPLGIATLAVHLVGRDPAGRWWVQQRAFDKAVDPGAWDTLMGGLSAVDETVVQTLERETWEEAGLHVAELQALAHRTPTQPLVVRRPVSDGYMVEHIEVYEAVVPAAATPVNQDGEVARFECVDTAALQQRLAADLFTLEAALVLAHVHTSEDAAP